ncbi:MAG TPA: hypothetical protein VK666_00485 [Chryseolinea sp.]|nr:hypothetical protein [Chryseolinea sp.]
MSTPDSSNCIIESFQDGIHLIRTQQALTKNQLEELFEIQTLYDQHPVGLNKVWHKVNDKQWLLHLSNDTHNFSWYVKTSHGLNWIGC